MTLQAVTNVFAGNPLNRASEKRRDDAWLAARAADPESLVVVLWNGAPLVETKNGEPRLAYVSVADADAAAAGPEQRLFMGLWKETAVFALDLDGSIDPALGPFNGLGEFKDLRGLALRLTPAEAAIAATAKGVFEWRRRHPRCSVCGEATRASEGGWKRVCGACKAEHFPRTDPVVIMLAVNGDRCLLGRQAAWPKGMWSALAGFVEPGESLEEACARELKEEADLDAVRVTYHSAQPWPYPSSLMIGLHAEVADGEAIADVSELEAVRWFTRDEAKLLVEGKLEGAFAPPPLAIAHQLIKTWALDAK